MMAVALLAPDRTLTRLLKGIRGPVPATSFRANSGVVLAVPTAHFQPTVIVSSIDIMIRSWKWPGWLRLVTR